MDPEHRYMHTGPMSQHLCGWDLGSLHQVCEHGLSDCQRFWETPSELCPSQWGRKEMPLAGWMWV